MMDNMTKWLGRTLVAGAAALMVLSAAFSVTAHAQGAPEAPPAATSGSRRAASQHAASPRLPRRAPALLNRHRRHRVDADVNGARLMMTIPDWRSGGMVRKECAGDAGAKLWRHLHHHRIVDDHRVLGRLHDQPRWSINLFIGGFNYFLLADGLNATSTRADDPRIRLHASDDVWHHHAALIAGPC
jgi:hypothetical protein